jgi:hypothetical protein
MSFSVPKNLASRVQTSHQDAVIARQHGREALSWGEMGLAERIAAQGCARSLFLVTAEKNGTPINMT